MYISEQGHFMCQEFDDTYYDTAADECHKYDDDAVGFTWLVGA